MQRLRFLFFAAQFLCFPFNSLLSQDTIFLQSPLTCSYANTSGNEKIFRLPLDTGIVKWIEEILNAGGVEKNFEIVNTSSLPFLAVYDQGKRYFFYNADDIRRSESSLEFYGSLLHAIGHHVFEHTFLPEHLILEELEADHFMGFVLSQNGVRKSSLMEFIEQSPPGHPGIPASERMKAALDGFEKSDKALVIQSLPFDNDPSLEVFTKAAFPFPPPQCHTQFEIPDASIAGIHNLGEVDKKITTALRNLGYTHVSHLSVPNGFAIVTQLEQYNPDGTIKQDNTRWRECAVRNDFKGILDYISALIIPNKSLLRIFVFICANQAFTSSNDRISKEQATAWLAQGVNRLPKSIAEISSHGDYSVSVLVYEFEVPESTQKPVQICPAPHLDAQKHLEYSGLKNALGGW